MAKICRKLGISEQTFYRWKKKFGEMVPSEIKKMKQLEKENRRLKGLVADLTLDKQILHEVLRKKRLRPAERRLEIHSLQSKLSVSERRGSTSVESMWTSSAPASPSTMPTSSRSTVAFGTSA